MVEGRMWDLIVSILDHCLFFYFALANIESMNLYIIILFLTSYLKICAMCKIF